MTKNEFKQGDKVYMAYDPTISAVVTDVCKEGKYDYYVRENGADFTQGCYEYELLDAKTAFLKRLQSLLREFDVSICGGTERERDLVKLNFESDYIIYRNGDSRTYAHINADNIMDFDKE